MLLDKLYLLCDFGTCTKLCKCITKYPPPPAAQQAGNLKRYPAFSSVPSMALILLVKVRSQVFTAKCSEPQVGTSNGMDEGSGVTKFLSLRTET